jgi:hypothetical protein
VRWRTSLSGRVVLLAVSLALGTLFVLAGTDASASTSGPTRFVAMTQKNLANFSLGVGQSQGVQVSGQVGIPASGVRAVMLNVVAQSGTAPTTFLTVWPGGTRPATSNLHAAAGDVVSNSMVVQLSDSGGVSVYNHAGTIAVRVDVLGYFVDADPAADGGFVVVPQARLLDTRTTAAIPAGGSIDLQVAGVANVDAAAASVFVNLTAVAPNTDGSIVVKPRGSTTPIGQMLQFEAGQGSISNSASVVPDAQGYVRIFNTNGSTQPVHVIVDVQGFFDSTTGAGDAFTPTTARVYDSRADGLTPLAAGEAMEVKLDCVSGLPGTGMTSVFANVMALDPAASGNIKVWASDQAEPGVWASVFQSGENRASLVAVPLSAEDGSFMVKSTAAINIVIDVQGWFGTAEATGGPAEADDTTAFPDIRTSLTGPSALARSPEITATAVGQDALSRMRAAHLEEEGEALDTTGYKVYNTTALEADMAADERGILIAPPGDTLLGVTTSADGTGGFAGCGRADEVGPVNTDPSEDDVVPAGSVTTAASELVWKDADCWWNERTGRWEFFYCRRWASVHRDGSMTYDYWLQRRYGRCKSKGAWAMVYCGTGSKKKPGTATQTWQDYGPEDDTKGCQTISAGVNVMHYNVGYSWTGCDRHDITQWRTAPGFSAYWKKGGFYGAFNKDVKFRYQTSTRVTQRRPPVVRGWWHYFYR